MKIEIKSFDYRLIHIGRDKPQIINEQPDFQHADVQFNYKILESQDGPVIIVFSRIRIVNADYTVRLYQSQSHYLIPVEQSVHNLTDHLVDIDNVVLVEMTMKHFGIESQFIFEDTGGFLVQTQSFYSILKRLEQFGNELTN